MKCMILALVSAAFLTVGGCTTKVYNETPAVGHTTVIEKERPVVMEKPSTPEVQNNIRVESR